MLSLLLLFAFLALLTLFGLVVSECFLKLRILVSRTLTNLDFVDMVAGAKPVYHLLQTVILENVVI